MFQHCHRIGLLAGIVLLFASVVNADEGPEISGDYRLVPGLNQTSLLLQGDQLTRLASDGITVKEKHKLPAVYSHIAERDKHFVALSADPRAIVVLDKKTLQPLRSKKLQYMKLTDLAVHPKIPVSYVAVKFDIEAPRYRVIVFNEETGDAHEPRSFFGTWVKVHPAGTFLVTGHSDIYEKGTRFFINPGFRLHTTPEYGSIDLMISYGLDGKGMPNFMDLKTKAGGNGKGLRMSADGKRVTYLSHVGYPQYSGNLGGFDPLDLQKLPVAYETKGKGNTSELIYHPSLPICASRSKTGAVFFERETGKPEKSRISDSIQFDQVHRIYFSGDGKQIIFDCERDGKRALRSAGLNLSAREKATAEKRVDHGRMNNLAEVQAAMKKARRSHEEKLDPAGKARDRAIDWIRLNNTLGPNHKIVADQASQIDKLVDAEKNFYIVFGKGLVKSKSPTMLCIWNKTFFAFPLSEKQAADFDFPKMHVVVHSSGKNGWRLFEQRGHLHKLAIESENSVDPEKKITGKINLKRIDGEKGYYALKLQYVIDKRSITSYHHLGQYLLKEDESISFEFPAIGKTKYSGPIPVFIELVTFATSDRTSEPAIASNTIATIINVKKSK